MFQDLSVPPFKQRKIQIQGLGTIASQSKQLVNQKPGIIGSIVKSRVHELF